MECVAAGTAARMHACGGRRLHRAVHRSAPDIRESTAGRCFTQAPDGVVSYCTSNACEPLLTEERLSNAHHLRVTRCPGHRGGRARSSHPMRWRYALRRYTR